jgi:Tfp pilus assembly protein PilZ
MLKPISKRSYPRFQVPGATISYKDQIHPLVNLGRGGLSFLAKEPLKLGREVSFHLMLSKKKDPIHLRGSVVYCIPSPVVNNHHNIGIRFASFTASRGANSPEIPKILEQLENAHVDHSLRRGGLFP